MNDCHFRLSATSRLFYIYSQHRLSYLFSMQIVNILYAASLHLYEGCSISTWISILSAFNEFRPCGPNSDFSGCLRLGVSIFFFIIFPLLFFPGWGREVSRCTLHQVIHQHCQLMTFKWTTVTDLFWWFGSGHFSLNDEHYESRPRTSRDPDNADIVREFLESDGHATIMEMELRIPSTSIHSISHHN